MKASLMVGLLVDTMVSKKELVSDIVSVEHLVEQMGMWTVVSKDNYLVDYLVMFLVDQMENKLADRLVWSTVLS